MSADRPNTDTFTVYISIGNSDDKLSQVEWSAFVTTADRLLSPDAGDSLYPVKARHGNWRSVPDDPWQNACWCVEVDDDADAVRCLKGELESLAQEYGQDSIAWAEVDGTEFISPTGATNA
jgi:hypothetical protein